MPFARARKRSQNSERNAESLCECVYRALLVEAFPLSMRTLMTSRIRDMNRKNPHYTSSFEDPYRISEHCCEKTALLNSIFQHTTIILWNYKL